MKHQIDFIACCFDYTPIRAERGIRKISKKKFRYKHPEKLKYEVKKLDIYDKFIIFINWILNHHFDVIDCFRTGK